MFFFLRLWAVFFRAWMLPSGELLYGLFSTGFFFRREWLISVIALARSRGSSWRLEKGGGGFLVGWVPLGSGF